MRILSFSKIWPKLYASEFTTFRFPRKDRDWEVGEAVQLVYKTRTPERRVWGTATIIGKEPKWVHEIAFRDGVPFVTDAEAIIDGFVLGHSEMISWVGKAHNYRNYDEPMNKLTLRWEQP